MQLRLLLVDFDGTLADTRKANAQAYVAALREVGYTMSEEEYLAHHFGVRCPDFLRSIGITSLKEIDHIRRRKIALYPTFFDSIRLNHPLWEFCQHFRRQGGKVWIVSTGQPENLRNAMHHLGLENQVDGVLAANDVEQHKPHPEAFLKAMALTGCRPEETLIFEDSPVGLEAARRSGAAWMKIDFSQKLSFKETLSNTQE